MWTPDDFAAVYDLLNDLDALIKAGASLDAGKGVLADDLERAKAALGRIVDGLANV